MPTLKNTETSLGTIDFNCASGRKAVINVLAKGEKISLETEFFPLEGESLKDMPATAVLNLYVALLTACNGMGKSDEVDSPE